MHLQDTFKGGFCFAILFHLKGLGGPVCSNHLRTLHFVLAGSCIYIYIFVYIYIIVYIYILITITIIIIVVLLYTIIVLYIYIMIDIILHSAYNYIPGREICGPLQPFF